MKFYLLSDSDGHQIHQLFQWKVQTQSLVLGQILQNQPIWEDEWWIEQG